MFKHNDPMLDFLLKREEARRSIARGRHTSHTQTVKTQANENARKDEDDFALKKMSEAMETSSPLGSSACSAAAAEKVRFELQDGDDGRNIDQDGPSQFAHSSKYYDLQKWTASCLLTIEHMRLLQ